MEKINNDTKNIKALTWLSGGHFVNDIYTGLLNPIMPFIAAKLAFSMAICNSYYEYCTDFFKSFAAIIWVLC